MANIYIDVGEFPGRLRDVIAWLHRGDAVFITNGLTSVFRVLPAEAEVSVPQPAGGCKERILGLHRGAITVPPDFNEPLPAEFWAGESK